MLMNRESLTNIVDDSPAGESPFEIGNSDCKQFIMSQNPRSPELGSRRIEAKGCPEDMRNHFRNSSERTQDYENYLPTYGNTSCSYDVREAGPKDQSRACYERDAYSMSPAPQHGTDNGSRGETVYLTVRRRQPSGKSPRRSSVQGISRDMDFRGEDMNVGWERCTVFDGEGFSCLGPESKDGGSEQSATGRKSANKGEGNDQVIDEYTLKQLSNAKNSPRVEHRSPLSSMDDRKAIRGSAVGGSISGSESDLKEMTTQPKRRILINTSNSRPFSDVQSEKESHPDGSPERCWVSKAQPRNIKQDHPSPSNHSNTLPRSTPSRNVNADGNASYWSPSGATPMDARANGQQKACDAGTNEEKQHQNSLRTSKDNGSEHSDKFPSSRSEQGSQRSLQLNPEYEQSSWMFDSRDSSFMRLNKICEGEHTDIDESAAQHSMSSNLAVPSSPAVNFELKRKVEELEKQIADERKKFQVVADRLAEQQVEADKNVQQMQDDWDGKIRELQKEKYALSIRLQSTETAHLASLLAGQRSTRGSVQPQEIQSAVQPAQSVMQPATSIGSERHVSSHRQHEDFLKELEADQARQVSGRVKAPQLSDEVVLKLKQEILQQEVLIRGYQHENEKAMKKIKEIQAEAKEKARSMTEENAKLASQIILYQRRDMSSGPLAATELSLQEALDREAHLKKLEVQLKKEIARLKDELLKAHAELERKEKKVSKTLNDQESEIESLKKTLTEERESHARTCFSRDDMMNSLSENQKLLSSHQSTIEHQEAQILELGGKVAYYEGEGEHTSKKVEEDWHPPSQDKRSASVIERSSRRIQPPLKQGRKPEFVHKCVKNGLIALAQTSKDESDKVRKLQMELAALRKHKNNEDENSKSLNMLKQELENAKQEYEKRLQHLQVAHPDMEPAFANEQLAQNRVKALETQVVNIRIHYSRKLKELSDKLAESKNEQSKLKVAVDNAAQLKKIPPNRTIKVKELQDAKERIGILEDVLQLKEHSIKNLQNQLEQFQAEGKGNDPGAANSITAKQVASLSKIKSKIQSSSPQRGHPIHPDGKFHDSEEPSRSSPKVSSVLFENHEAGDELEEQKLKELKRVNSVSPSLLRDDSPLESEPDVWFSHCAFRFPCKI
ncbi:hypothetical protein M758_5G103900 [Ceratodon purpureus]|nr:hypothetical protein M758_5G103900 [Ceratodon purpureus]